MKTLIIIFKTYDQNIVFRDCQMYIFNIYFERKRRFFNFLPSFCWTSCQNQPVLDYFWDICRDWERPQGTTTLHGRLGLQFSQRTYLFNFIYSIILHVSYFIYAFM